MPSEQQPDGCAPCPDVLPSRELAGLELAMRLTDDATPFNVVSVLRVGGDLTAATLRTALDQLQRRHPFLRSRIAPAGKKFFFHFDATGPIPLHVEESVGSGGWIAAAEEELHGRFELTAGPLMRCRYLPRASSCDLIVTIHHSIVDAASAPHLFGELLSLCGGLPPGDDGRSGEEGRLPGSALFPMEFSGVRMGLATAAFMGRQMSDEMKFRWRSRGVRKAPIFAEGRCRLLPIRFPAALTAALVQASRRERVTLNAMLSAGLMAAVQRRLYPTPRAPLRHIIFADLRPRLRETVPDSVLGCLLSMFRFTVVVERDGGFWPLARNIQESTLRAARSGERYLSFALSPGMLKMILSLKAFRMGATALSYSGPTTLPVSYGPLELTELHAFAANFTLGPEYSALVRLFRGELWWDILYLDSDMDHAGAQEIAHEMQAILEGATC